MSRKELLAKKKFVQQYGRFVGIRPSHKKLIKVYRLKNYFAELHFEKQLGLVIDARFVKAVEHLVPLEFAEGRDKTSMVYEFRH